MEVASPQMNITANKLAQKWLSEIHSQIDSQSPVTQAGCWKVILDRCALKHKHLGNEIAQRAHLESSRSLEILPEQRLIQRLCAFVLCSCLIEAPPDRIKGLGSSRLCRVEPCVQYECGEIALFFKPAENSPDFSHHQLEHRDLLVQQLQHLLLQGAARHQIEDEHFPILTDTIDTADALLDRHRIPGYVEIDQCVAELNVAPLAAGFRREQNRHVFAEFGNRCIFCRCAQATVKARKGYALCRE